MLVDRDKDKQNINDFKKSQNQKIVEEEK